MSLTDQVQELGTRVLDLIFPPRCVHCKKVGDGQLCQTCRADFTVVRPEHTCTHCGRPRSDGSTCPDCLSHMPAAAPIRSAYVHEGPVQSAIWALKYDNRRGLALTLAEAVTDVIPIASVQEFDMLCPVPLHPDREAERGFNQARLLADQLRRAWPDLPVANPGGLSRVRHTQSQVGLNRIERQGNVAEAFTADAGRMRGKSIILIDDVCTTGSTLNACAEALITAGASHVAALTVSRALSTDAS